MLNRNQLFEQLSGLGVNTTVVVRGPAGTQLYEIQKVDLENKTLVLTAGREFNPEADTTQQEAGAIKPTTQEVLHNDSGISFAASGTNRGTDGPASGNAADQHNSVQENLGTELGSGAVKSADTAGKDPAALPITPQPDVGKTTSEASGQPSTAKPGEVKSGGTTAAMPQSTVAKQ